MSDSLGIKKRMIFGVVDKALLIVALLAVFLLLMEWGWGDMLAGWFGTLTLVLNAFVIIFFMFENFTRLFLAESLRRGARSNLFELLLTLLFIALLVASRYLYRTAFFGDPLREAGVSLTEVYLAVGQGYVVLMLIAKAVVFQKYLTSIGVTPAAFVMFTFAFTIIIGTVLLSSPHAVRSEWYAAEGTLPLVDAFFTATSAVCVTGLIVRDTGTYFSMFGQSVILVLIQIGGLGLMTFVTFSSLLIGKGIALHEGVVMQDLLAYDVRARLPRIITYILMITFLSEAAGVLLFYPVWIGDYTGWERLYVSVFHSVSSFCNAGFSLFSNSYADYRGSIVLNATATTLIIFGGLGFMVQRELLAKAWSMLRYRWMGRRRLLKDLAGGEPPHFLSLQTRVVVVTTALLLAAGALLFAALEWRGALAGMPLREKLLASWFQGVTPRTAGFNTVDISLLASSSYLFLMVLMYIGASPGGTGGGIKTSTFALLAANVAAGFRHRRHTEMMRRAVPMETSRQALMVAMLGMGLIVAGTFVLGLSERGVAFERLLFEQVSAFGTVGLSTGTDGTPLSLSASLSWLGKSVIIVTMFLGRIGPLTIVVMMAQQRRTVEYEYPAERVIIG